MDDRPRGDASEGDVLPAPSVSQAERSADARSGTVGAVVLELARELRAAGVEEPAKEARDIVAAVVDMPRFWPSLNAGESLSTRDLERARTAAAKRASGAPFAYAVGRAAFRHLTLDVDERVLIPRQETEVLVDAVLECAGAGGVVVDVGTGSGAIALALAMEGSFDLVIGTDVSLGALSVARANAERLAPALRSRVELRAGSLLAPVRDVRARVVVSNPPYIAYEEAAALPRSVRDWEPVVALYTGAGGMSATADIVRGAPEILESGGLLALEIDSRRAALAAEMTLADGRYTDVTVRLDLAGRERILLARRV
ncbi:MAG TPA: peptide chain release factor N(5)-glutamine methyltransferase [Gemmatimonadaceae bacterium]|nr:peptide chain release factor N(5)-glutamine methyltransferase [Gemmatimonadaceae bacterium]